jgi:cytochrome c biogenesis protein CcdA
MTGVLITFQLASLAVLVWAFWSGYYSTTVRAHILIALGATALSVFSHCMIMMYVVAIGRMIRQTVEQASLDASAVVQTKEFRKIIFRWATVAMIVVMAQTILGGGAHTKAFPLWVHLWLGIFAFAISVIATIVEIRILIANHLLGHRVARQYESKKPQRHKDTKKNTV